MYTKVGATWLASVPCLPWVQFVLRPEGDETTTKRGRSEFTDVERDDQGCESDAETDDDIIFVVGASASSLSSLDSSALHFG
jgi:hypothetical protein